MSPFNKNQILVFALLFLTFGCKQKNDASVEIVTIGNSKIPVIHVDKITEKAEVKLSDWVTDLHLIHLETNEKSAFNFAMRVFAGKEYVIISTPGNGILMFDQNGKFVRVLANVGKGPGEVMDANRNIFVDEDNDRLYVADMVMMTQRLLSYGIKSGGFTSIPLMHKGPEIGIRDIIVLEDSLLYITTMQVRGRTSNCPLFCQTTSGKLLWEISRTHPLGLTDASIQLADGRIYMYYNFSQDTTWVVEGQQLRPVAVVTTDLARAYPDEKVGTAYVGLYPLTDHLFTGSWTTIKSVEFDKRYNMNRATYSDRETFVFDSKTNRAKNIGAIQNDFLGTNEKFYPQFHPNGTMTASFQALDLREMADSVSKLPGTSPEAKKRLENILQTVSENDNPVLLVGKVKI